MYEAYGGRGRVELAMDVPIKSASLCNILEDIETELEVRRMIEDCEEKATFEVTFRAFEFKTVRIVLA